MKTDVSNKGVTVRHKSELVEHFRQFLTEDPDLHWHLPPGIGYQPPQWVELELDNQRLRFAPIYELKLSLPLLESLQPALGDPPPLLVTPELSSRVLDSCRQRGIAAIDLNGRTLLRAPGLYVDRRALPGRSFRFELEPRNIFAGKSAQIVRSLLTDRDRTWTQSEILPRTRASSGLVSRIIQHLISQGYAEKISAREFRLCDHAGLLDAWAESDHFAKRNRTTRYSAFASSPVEIARQIHAWAKRESVPIAITQWVAGWLRHPYTEPVIASAYVGRLPDAATLQEFGFRPVVDGGKLWLHVPDDEGVFLETQLREQLPLASDAQIYLDLQKTGLRGPEQASALREWEGFCKP